MLKGVALLLSLFVPDILGRGRMVEPVGRQSRWRIDEMAPINYNDDELDCGGFIEQWRVNNGECGLCGDSYSLKKPRPHELGGVYGGYAIVRNFMSGQVIPVSVKLSPDQRGHFFFDLCNLDEMPESEECFARNHMGVPFIIPSAKPLSFGIILSIPTQLKCQHCVLRWTYRGENNYGTCLNGTQQLGCGPQAMLRNCADISIM